MKKAIVAAAVLAVAAPAFAADRVKTANGTVEGVTSQSGVHAYLGIPFAAPPVGDLRWKPPQPVKNWTGGRSAAQFGPRCMQASIFSDMNFRSNGMSEDCLYLNVWTPATSGSERLPVLVYFYGGGFVAGDGSEPRYDGESMARKGIVSLTVNYRLGVFGFLAHPDLTKESPHHASGNYALLDLRAALQWVQKNIAAFGGDPKRVTIAGESAGSIAVSAQMASPLSKALIAGAIGESGALIAPTLPPVPLAQGEEVGTTFATSVGATSLAALRAMSAAQIQDAAAKLPIGRFASTVDGYVLPKLPVEIFAAGEQARVPLLVGWNTEESGARAILAAADPTPENFAKALQTLYGDRANDALKVYGGSTSDEVWQAATDLASDRFIGYSTWKWADLHGRTGEKPVYRYLYAHPRPQTHVVTGSASSGAGATPRPERPRGAAHSAEIEYAMGNLATNKVYAWTPDDYRISEVMQAYFANFVKTGNPNGPGVPQWPAANNGPLTRFIRLDIDSRAEPDKTRERYLFLDTLYVKPPKEGAVCQSPRDGGCTEWRDCRQLALAAADRGEYESFHDLAWRAVQAGPPKDPALMYLLARAQALSGRAHDALVMLQRLAEMGVGSDAVTSDDFARTRQLPGWPEVAARIDRLTRPHSPLSAAAAAASSSPSSPPAPEAVRFSTEGFALGGLAYDAVSHRFLLGDRRGRKLIVVGEGSNHAVDFVRADSAGFHEISAIEIDARRGDLWVASAAQAGGAGTLHKLQLVSGRPLRAFRVAADLEPVEVVDLAVTPAGAVLVLDSASRQLLVLRAGGTSLERVVRIDAGEPASLAAGGDDGIAYVAHREGVSRIDLRARTATPVAAPNSVSLAHLERIRWRAHTLIAVRVDDDGSRRIVRLELNANGSAVTRATTLGTSAPAAGQTFATISGDELVYAVDDAASGAAEFVAYRVHLR